MATDETNDAPRSSKATPVREKPILFSAPMIRAICDGSKAQTRRTAKLRVVGNITTIQVLRGEHKGSFAYLTDEHGIAWSPAGGDPLRPYPHPERCCPYGEPGDRLWVRETWAPCSEHIEERGEAEAIADAKAQMPWSTIVYRADANGGYVGATVKRWRPSIFLPRWASRISLAITGVRVERLQAITGEAICAEGAVARAHHDQNLGKCPVSSFDGKAYVDLRSLWAAGWDEINGKRAAWSTNPWVWVVEFQRIEQEKRSHAAE